MDLLQFVRGCTFDDFLFTPQEGLLSRRDPRLVDLSARFSEHITLKRPLVSANMDTVTRSSMAIVLAEEGGSACSTAGSAPGMSSRRSPRSRRSSGGSTGRSPTRTRFSRTARWATRGG